MIKKKIFGLVLFIFIFSSACIQMRDYVGTKDGAVGLDLKKGFGQGEVKKDYYVVSEGIGIVIGDTRDEVIAKMGIPDKVDSTLEGYESWIYNTRKIKLLFENDRLDDWQEY